MKDTSTTYRGQAADKALRDIDREFGRIRRTAFLVGLAGESISVVLDKIPRLDAVALQVMTLRSPEEAGIDGDTAAYTFAQMEESLLKVRRRDLEQVGRVSAFATAGMAALFLLGLVWLAAFSWAAIAWKDHSFLAVFTFGVMPASYAVFMFKPLIGIAIARRTETSQARLFRIAARMPKSFADEWAHIDKTPREVMG